MQAANRVLLQGYYYFYLCKGFEYFLHYCRKYITSWERALSHISHPLYRQRSTHLKQEDSHSDEYPDHVQYLNKKWVDKD